MENRLVIGRSIFVTPFTPLTCVFGEILKTRWFSMVRIYAVDAEVLYLQNTSKFPSWHAELGARSECHIALRCSIVASDRAREKS